MKGALGSEQESKRLGFVRALEAGGSWKIAGLAGAPLARGCGNVLSVSAGK